MTTTACLASLVATTALASAALSSVASAEEPAAATVAERSPFHADVEIDPTAYALSGYSLHVGLGWKRLRLDLGAFAMELPSIVQDNDDFDVSFDGFGAKLQYFAFGEQVGGFIGVDMAVARPLVERNGSDLAHRDTETSMGVNAGWRFDLVGDLYVTPWIGVGYSFDAEDVTLDGARYEAQRVTVFPAVHVGYRLR
jgi:hypothetical protein